MAFIPPLDDWVRSHFIGVAEETVAAIGPVAGLRVLDVGCGDGLIAFGLANAGATEVIGVDIKPLPADLVDSTVRRITEAGFPEVVQARPRVQLLSYDGARLPLEADSVDVVFSWGVFEHVSDVKTLLTEMKRVVKPDGVGFVKVFPWYFSLYGSHLSDFHAPFAHLTTDTPSLHAEVVATLDATQDSRRSLVLDHMWSEYLALNHYSADMFYNDFVECGFSSHTWKLISYPQDLSAAPRGPKLSDLMVCGSEVIFRK